MLELDLTHTSSGSIHNAQVVVVAAPINATVEHDHTSNGSTAHRRTRVAVFLLWRSQRGMLLTVSPGLTREDGPFLALAAPMYFGPCFPSESPMGLG